MLVYFSFVIPIVVSIILFIFFRHKVVWWELIIPMALSVLLVLLAKWMCVSSLTSDTEWWGGYVEDVRYYEPWDEEVPCSHPKYCNEYNSCCSKDSNGNCQSCYEEVQCGWQHAYDVDYHHEYWQANTTLGGYLINKKRYEELVRQFGTGKIFVDMHRDYHSIDGDMYKCDWDGGDATLEPVAQAHTYENRPQASHSLYHYDKLDSIDIRTYKPFDYPPVINQFHQQVLLGYNDQAAERRLQVLNSRLGHNKQVRVFLLIFHDHSREVGLKQEQYWEGGNKNELVVCVGVDNSNEVMWSHPFSWTDQIEVKLKIKNAIEEMNHFDINETINVINEEVNSEWVRKEFHDFDYLNIEPTMTQSIWILIITLLVNGGLAVWVVLNDFEADDNNFGRKKKKSFRWARIGY